MTILLVTWFLAGQAPHSYQVRFDNLKACESARTAVGLEGLKLANYGMNVAVSAVCVAQG